MELSYSTGRRITAGQMGENVTTRGIDLLGLPSGTRLHIGDTAVAEATGLRNPCAQLDLCHPGLMAEVLDHDDQGNLIRKAGIMGIILAGGEVRAGDSVHVEFPQKPYQGNRSVSK